MGLRFRKSIKISPGVNLNLNKNSASVSFGSKGAHYTINTNGKKTLSAGLSGTGISYVHSSGGSGRATKPYASYSNTISALSSRKNDDKEAFYEKTWFIVLMMFCCCFPVGIFLMWKYEKFPKIIRIIITALFAVATLSSLTSPKTTPDSSISTISVESERALPDVESETTRR